MRIRLSMSKQAAFNPETRLQQLEDEFTNKGLENLNIWSAGGGAAGQDPRAMFGASIAPGEDSDTKPFQFTTSAMSSPGKWTDRYNALRKQLQGRLDQQMAAAEETQDDSGGSTWWNPFSWGSSDDGSAARAEGAPATPSEQEKTQPPSARSPADPLWGGQRGTSPAAETVPGTFPGRFGQSDAANRASGGATVPGTFPGRFGQSGTSPAAGRSPAEVVRGPFGERPFREFGDPDTQDERLQGIKESLGRGSYGLSVGGPPGIGEIGRNIAKDFARSGFGQSSFRGMPRNQQLGSFTPTTKRWWEQDSIDL